MDVSLDEFASPVTEGHMTLNDNGEGNRLRFYVINSIEKLKKYVA